MTYYASSVIVYTIVSLIRKEWCKCMKKIKIEDAIGKELAHDLTQILPRISKTVLFKRGHIINEEDIAKLLDIGKKHIYVSESTDTLIHEEEAAYRMGEAVIGTSEDFVLSDLKEGRVNIIAKKRGVLRINRPLLVQLHEDVNICFATKNELYLVQAGDIVAGARVVPLAVDDEVVKNFERLVKDEGPLMWLDSITAKTTAIVTTGSEIKDGRITDKFGPILIERSKTLGLEMVAQVFVSDDAEEIRKEIQGFVEKGIDLIQVTGGMSVDPDDNTADAIYSLGGEVVTYGTPILPGAMFMLSYVGGSRVVGLPGGVVHAQVSAYDSLIPRICTDIKLKRRDIIELACGGLR